MRVLHRLHQAEVAFRQDEALGARQAARHRHVRDRQRARLAQQRRMPLAADAVEDDGGDRDVRPMGREAADDGRRARRLRAHVDDQHHRPADHPGEIGGRALADGGPVEQAHDPFADDDFAGPR